MPNCTATDSAVVSKDCSRGPDQPSRCNSLDVLHARSIGCIKIREVWTADIVAMCQISSHAAKTVQLWDACKSLK